MATVKITKSKKAKSFKSIAENLVDKINKKSDLFKETYTAKIVIPVGGEYAFKDALEWVFYQEFGTAGHQDTTASQYGLAKPKSKKYLIVPRKINPITGKPLRFLRWPDPEGKFAKFHSARSKKLEGVQGVSNLAKDQAFVPFVMHPGVRPKAFIRKSLEAIRNSIKIEVPKALTDNQAQLADEKQGAIAFRNASLRTITSIKKIIVANMRVAFPKGSRVDGGKLAGDHPADVFSREAKIVITQGKQPPEELFTIPLSRLKLRKSIAAIKKAKELKKAAKASKVATKVKRVAQVQSRIISRLSKARQAEIKRLEGKLVTPIKRSRFAGKPPNKIASAFKRHYADIRKKHGTAKAEEQKRIYRAIKAASRIKNLKEKVSNAKARVTAAKTRVENKSTRVVKSKSKAKSPPASAFNEEKILAILQERFGKSVADFARGKLSDPNVKARVIRLLGNDARVRSFYKKHK